MHFRSARLSIDLQPYWEFSYDEFFYDGWHHILNLGFIWIEWHTWNRIFWRWRGTGEGPAVPKIANKE